MTLQQYQSVLTNSLDQYILSSSARDGTLFNFTLLFLTSKNKKTHCMTVIREFTTRFEVDYVSPVWLAATTAKRLLYCHFCPCFMLLHLQCSRALKSSHTSVFSNFLVHSGLLHFVSPKIHGKEELSFHEHWCCIISLEWNHSSKCSTYALEKINHSSRLKIIDASEMSRARYIVSVRFPTMVVLDNEVILNCGISSKGVSPWLDHTLFTVIIKIN